ncbi:hypothetical protein QEN19_003894 [Hanseniaspora menglaensis]
MVRLKNRYILFEILYPPSAESTSENIVLQHRQQRKNERLNITSKMIVYELKKMIKLYLGDQGLAKANIMLQMKYFNSSTSMGILKCSFEFYKIVVLGLSMIQQLSSGGENGNTLKSIFINVLKLSGTIKKLEEFGIERNKQLIKRINFDQRKNNNLNHQSTPFSSSSKVDFLKHTNELNDVKDDDEFDMM